MAKDQPGAKPAGGRSASRGKASAAGPIEPRLPGIVDDAEEGAQGGYGGPQVCRIVGISYRQLDYWARTGLLKPSIAEARGSGTQRRYSYHDLLELKVIKRLLDGGISLKRARKAVECLRDGLGADLASTSLVMVGHQSVLARSDGEVVDLLRGGQGVFNVMSMGAVVDELDAALAELGSFSSPGHSSATKAPSAEPLAAQS